MPRTKITCKENQSFDVVFGVTHAKKEDFNSGLYFTENTDFFMDNKEELYVDFRHGRDSELKSKSVAKVSNIEKSDGVYVGSMNFFDEFKGTQIEQDAKDGKLFLSELTHGAKMQFDDDTGEIFEYPILELGLTDNPDLTTHQTTVKGNMSLKEFSNAWRSGISAGNPAKSNKGGKMPTIKERWATYWDDEPGEETKEAVAKELLSLKESADALQVENDALKAKVESLEANKPKPEQEETKTETDNTTKEADDRFKAIEDEFKSFKEASEKSAKESSDMIQSMMGLVKMLERGSAKETAEGGKTGKTFTLPNGLGGTKTYTVKGAE